jgi:hypothetical protein
MILRAKLKNLKRNLSQCHSDHHKSHMNFPGCELGPLRRETANLSHGMASFSYFTRFFLEKK